MGRFKEILGDTPYPASPGFERLSQTSRQAAASMEEVAGSLRAAVLADIRACGLLGATCDEVEVRLSLRHQTASARIRELALKGSIVDSGQTRPTRSGRPAAVHVGVMPR